MRKRYLNGPVGQIHAIEAGVDPDGGRELLVMLHASPLSAAFLLPQVQRMAASHHVLALDTPGHGASDPLPAPATSLADYARYILAVLAAEGIDRFALYGAATGAQIAVAIAKAAPERISRMVLDNCAHFPKERREEWEADYFPDLTPQADGTHWHRAWDIAAAQTSYFPWFQQTDETRIDKPAPPPEVITAMAAAFMTSRPSYDACYRLAFHSEDISAFDGLVVPTTLIDWEGSVVRRYVVELIRRGLPDCVAVRVAGPTLEHRLSALAEALQR